MAKRHYRVTWADALRGHDQALLDGGRAGIVNENSIRSALARPYSGYYRRIHQKAAALLHGIIKNHGFVDANKRTSLYLVELLLTRSDYRLNEGDMAVVEMITGVAADQIDFPTLVSWFEQRIERL